MKVFTFILITLFSLTIISCKTNKDLDTGEELSMEETDERSTKRPNGTMSKLDKLIADVGIEGRKAERFKTIYLKFQAKRMEIKNSGAKPQQMMQEAFKLKDMQNDEMEDILSDDEYERYLIAINDKAGRPQLKKEETPVK